MYDDPASVLANKKRGIHMQKLYIEGAKTGGQSDIFNTRDEKRKVLIF